MNGKYSKYLQYEQWQWYWNEWNIVDGGYLQQAVIYIHNMNDALEVLKYSLEQYIGFVVRQASSGLKGTWKLSTYIGCGSLRSVKSVKTKVMEA